MALVVWRMSLTPQPAGLLTERMVMEDKMDEELKSKWLAALRGGSFKQATGRLRRDDAYCCLGVLCMVADLPIEKEGVHLDMDGAEGYRPIEALLKSDLRTLRTLYRMNDDGSSFEAIADYIEKAL